MASHHNEVTVSKQLKVGDVFAIECSHGFKCFQFIARDETQMSSDVIVAFTPTFSEEALSDLNLLAESEVAYYAHCIIKLGLKLSTWRKLGHASVNVDPNFVSFRASSDYGNKAVTKSVRWWVWKINQPQVFVGPLTGIHQQAYIGIVFTPVDIIQWSCTGSIEVGGYPGY